MKKQPVPSLRSDCRYVHYPPHILSGNPLLTDLRIFANIEVVIASKTYHKVSEYWLNESTNYWIFCLLETDKYYYLIVFIMVFS